MAKKIYHQKSVRKLLAESKIQLQYPLKEYRLGLEYRNGHLLMIFEEPEENQGQLQKVIDEKAKEK